MRRWILAAALALLTSAPLRSIPEAQITRSRVRVVQAIADVAALDVLIDNSPAFCSLSFKAATHYTAIAPGTYNLRALPAGASSPVLANTLLKAEPNAAYSVALLGTRSSTKALILIDKLDAPPAGSSRVRFVHGVPGAPAVDIAIKGGRVLFQNVGYGSAGDYVVLPAGTYTLEVREASSGRVLADLPGIQVGAGVVYTVYGVGVAGGPPPVQALVTIESVGGRAVPSAP